VSRAVIRDMFPPADAQRVMSQVTIYFGVAPAVAPIIGGFLFMHMGWHSIFTLPFWLAAAGVALAWLFYWKKPLFPGALAAHVKPLQRLLDNKFYFDWFNENVLARLSRGLGLTLWTVGDKVLIDGAAVNGSAYTVGWLASVARRVQTGYLYSYAFWMVIGLALLLGWFLVGAR